MAFLLEWLSSVVKLLCLFEVVASVITVGRSFLDCLEKSNIVSVHKA